MFMYLRGQQNPLIGKRRICDPFKNIVSMKLIAIWSEANDKIELDVGNF